MLAVREAAPTFRIDPPAGYADDGVNLGNVGSDKGLSDVTLAMPMAARVVVQTAGRPDSALTIEVRGFLARAAACSTGTTVVGCGCGEHDPRWLDVLAEALGHEPHVLVARGGEAPDAPIVGYLPLCLVKSRLFGRFLTSLPYLNRGGVIALDRVAATALIDKAVELASELDVNYLELRHGAPFEHPQLNARRDEKFRMVLPLPGNADVLWKSFDAKVRNQIRKGEKSDLKLQWGGGDVLDEFYDVFAENMRDLGTPVYGKSLFASILEHFPAQAELAVVRSSNRPVAGALLVHDMAGPGQPRCTQVPSASALRSANPLNANMWMYHQLLLRALDKGAAEFDFGRSSEGSGTYRFKKQWGAQPQATVWQYHVRRGDINAVRPDSPKYQRRIAVWQRLPVWLTRMLGPGIVRGIP